MKDDYDLFISYRHGTSKDWPRTQLFERLQIQHYPDGRNPNIFIDLYEICAGKAWFPQLSAAIENCRNFLSVFTVDYFQAEMCCWELERAHSLDRAGIRGFVLPLLYEPEARRVIPFAYKGLQYLDVRNPDWFSRLCKHAGLIETALPDLKDFFVRVWVEPAQFQLARTRDITIVPKELRGDRFRLGMDVRIGFQATADCYVTLLDIGTSGSIKIIYPTDQSSLGFCRKGITYYFPTDEDSFRFELAGNVGKEKIRAYATRERLKVGSIEFTSAGQLELSQNEYVDASCTFEIVV